ncbi:cell wall hydrolase [Azospirillum sp. sgz301742]
MNGLTNEIIAATFPERRILALTAWGEARGDGERGMQAVINVVQNRASRPRWWGRDVTEVCLKPHQFSCWLDGDPNRAKMLDVTPYNEAYRTAYRLATQAEEGRLPDVTGGADHYHSLHMMTPPTWAQGHLPLAFIENHVFYRLEK